jgi:hypothetical protein
MSVNIKDILDELYALDPDLREKESEIKKIIEKMMKNRPEVEINETFRSELREKIMREIATMKKPAVWLPWWAMVGALSLCLIVGIWLSSGVFTQKNQSAPLSFRQNIESTGAESFGTIALPNQNNPRPQSGGGGGMGLGGGGDTVSSKMMAPDAMIYPPIDMPLYTYVYKGEVKIPEENLPVYKKTNLPFNSSDTATIVRNLSLADINLDAFKRLGISNLTLTEDVEYGYMLNLDFMNGTINMYQNYMKWPQPVCDKNGCVQPPKLTEKDIPADSEVINVSNQFVSKYNIDISQYGAPIVDKSWRIWYARSAELGQEQMIPDMYTVTYPIMLDGKPVYQEGGMYRGLTFNYDVRTKRITGMYGIEKADLKKSTYETIKKTDLINEMIKNGGRYIMTDTTVNKDRKVVELTLSEPSLNYVTIYGEWKDGKTEEYYVPAYVFPVENAPKEGYAPQTIIIPLVEEFVQRMEGGPMDPIIYSAKPAAEPAVIQE